MKYVIGIDIGGTKINGVLWNGKSIVKELTIVTPDNLFDFEKNLIKLCDFLSAKNKISGVGVGMAGIVDKAKAQVVSSPNIKFANNLNLAKLFKLNGYTKVEVDNDANCFTRAELTVGLGKKFKNFLAFTLGTGVGGGMVLDGKIYRGATGRGAEFGHMVFGENYLEKTFQKYRDQNNYKEMGKLMGRAFASLANVFIPDAIILGGAVSLNAGKKFLPYAQSELKKFVLDKSKIPGVYISKLKNAGAVGAALIIK